ncbi:hypothetical protein DFH08DRAFT_865092 [Mycena albidolilacea]|uniref:Uncharacterized protein n=1 Tax=Mycena albidolilacea TaxID=1033008 RepID=A0AAD7ETT6_9AGAR|nr:hypothetical protein DFH08DRAFT_865092 [Mycena albidolilacea]
MAEKNNVTAQNEKVFKDFKKKLSSVQSYAQTAEKFRKWLGIDKAYYTDARPRIVDILLTAEDTLRKEGPTQNYTELARAFIKLVCTVEPFQARFIEPELQVSIRHLLETVVILQAPHPAPSGSQASAPPPPVPMHAPSFPSTAIDPSQQMRPSSSSLAAALTQAPLASSNRLSVAPTPPPAYTKGSSSPLVSVTPAISPPAYTKEKLAAVAPASTKQDSNKPISLSVPETQSPPIVTLTANVAPPPSADSGFGSASAPLPPVASKPKRKKKKKGDDLANLMQVDVQKYYEKRGTIPKPTEGTQIGNTASSTSAVAVSSPVQVTQTVLKPAVADSPSVSISSLPKSRPDTPMKEELKAKKPAPVDGMQSSDADVIKGIKAQSDDIEMTAATSSVPDAASGALSIGMNDEVNRVLHTLTGLAPLEVAIPEAVGPDGLKSDETAPPVSHIIDHSSVPEGPSQPTQAAASVHKISREGSADMDMDTSQESSNNAVMTRAVEPETLVEEQSIPTPASFRAIIEDVVNNVNRLLIADTDVSLEPGGFSTADLPIPNPQEGSDDIVPSSKTGLEAATVIAHHRGLASGSITITFSIKQNQMDSIKKWNDRSKHSDDLGDSLCLSLLCLEVTDVKARVESSQSNDLRTLLPEFECSWPDTGGLNMDVLWNGQRTNFPMSPPFALPPNGLVDVSPFLVLGQNTLCITTTHDMSKNWLLLCAHHPTPYQLNVVARRRHKERNWTGWLEKISQPLQLPFSIPIQV